MVSIRKPVERSGYFKTNDEITSSPAVLGGVVYFSGEDGFTYAVDAKTGKQKWKFGTGEIPSGSPTLAHDTIYVGGFQSDPYRGTIYALDAKTGKQKAAYKMDNWVFSSAVANNGVVYFGTQKFAPIPSRATCTP